MRLRLSADRVSLWRKSSLLLGTIVAAVAILSAFLSPALFFQSYLVSFAFWTGLSLGGLAILMVFHLTGGAWGETLSVALYSNLRTLPLLPLFFIPILLGTNHLFGWSSDTTMGHGHSLHGKEVYLNFPFFLARALAYFVVWITLALLLMRGGRGSSHSGLSAPGLVLYVLTVTFSSIDWMMSIDPHWYSSMYGVLVIAGQTLSAFAFNLLIILAILSSQIQPASIERPPSKTLLDLGNLLLMLVSFWAYISFSQFLIIWYGNLPEEATWYIDRTTGLWAFFPLGLIVFHFAVPFVLLLSRTGKQRAERLFGIAGFLLVMQFLNLTWLILPSYHDMGWLGLPLSIVFTAGLGSFWLFVYSTGWTKTMEATT